MVLLRSLSVCAVGSAFAALGACAVSGVPSFDQVAPGIEAGADATNEGAAADAVGASDARADDAAVVASDASADAVDGASDGALSDAPLTVDGGGDASVGGALDVPQPPGAKVTAVVTLPASPKIPRLTLNACGGASLGFSSATSFAYVTLRNTDPLRGAVVSVWTSRAPGGPVVDTLIASYASAAPPQSNSERLACATGVAKRCYATAGDPTACLAESAGKQWAGLMDGDGNGVRVPAASSVVVYVASYDSSGAGDVVVSVRTEALR